MMVDDATDADPTSDGNPKSYTPDDLVELVRAVKFAHSDMSVRNVHSEISVAMAASDPAYAFLEEVKLNDVKKVWKRALKHTASRGGGATPPARGAAAATPAGHDPVVPAEGVIKFYTVGDGSVKTLAEEYGQHHAAAAAAAGRRPGAAPDAARGQYAHFFLDVPADRSGARPHQALINFQDNRQADGGRRRTKKREKAPKSAEEARDIFKIQLAVLPPGMEEVLPPMLLYNAKRTAKTFLHPPSSSSHDEEDDGGYVKIKKLITDGGTTGALGATGGQKAYFYGFVTKTKSELDVVSIDLCSGLAPCQTW